MLSFRANFTMSLSVLVDGGLVVPPSFVLSSLYVLVDAPPSDMEHSLVSSFVNDVLKTDPRGTTMKFGELCQAVMLQSGYGLHGRLNKALRRSIKQAAIRFGKRAQISMVDTDESVFRLLGSLDELRLVVNMLDENDAHACASVCRCFREAILSRFPLPRGIRTSADGALASVARLEWSVSIGFHIQVKHMRLAARMGHLEVLRWARANGFEWIAERAARVGLTFELMQDRRTGSHMDADTCKSAAEGGHLEVLQWARANGCEWDSDTCAIAAQGGHLEMLQWARANCCVWDEWTCASAAGGGTWRCCSGRGRMGATGRGRHAAMRLGEATLRWCIGR